MYHSFLKVEHGHHAPQIFLFGCYTECVYETKIHDIDNLRKCLTQTSFFFTLTRTLSTLRLTSDATVCIRSCVRGGGGHFEHML